MRWVIHSFIHLNLFSLVSRMQRNRRKMESYKTQALLGHRARARAASSLVYSAVFLADESTSFHFFANNSKLAGRRKLKFSHNAGIHQS